MKSRIFSTLFLMALLFCAVYFGKTYGAVALMTLISSLALFEFYRLAEHFGGKPRKVLGVAAGIIYLVLMFWAAKQGELDTKADIYLLTIAAFVIIGAFILMRPPQKIPEIVKVLSTGIGILYLPFMIGFYALLAGEYNINGIILCVWIVLSAKFTDIGGLLVGCSIGKHKLAPNISPKKTWEGVVGGLVFSMIASAGFIAAIRYFDGWTIADAGIALTTFTPLKAALLALPIAAFSVVSDLIESVFKRAAGDKDSGATIPGIGGALDLLDSLVLVAPIGYCIVKFFILKSSF